MVYVGKYTIPMDGMGIYTVNRQRVNHPAEIHQADPIGTSTDSMMPPLFGRACASAHALEPAGGNTMFKLGRRIWIPQTFGGGLYMVF